MSGSSPGRLLIVLEAERVGPEVTVQYWYRIMRHIARMSPAIDRM